jgi:branched-chain amino acid transport system permease protein
MILGVAAVGIGFLMHQCGLVMFGVAAFIGLPAYWSAWRRRSSASAEHGGAARASREHAVRVLVGALVVRARPLPFAMLTLALAQMLKSVATLQAMRPLTGGDDGLAMTFNGTFLTLTQSELAKPAVFWPVAWIALCAVLTLAWCAGRARFGQILRATQANEERMRFSGFDTYVPRLIAFTLAAFIVSVSGVLIALNSAFASAELLDFATGGHALVAMLVGGGGTVGGPLVGALLYTWGQDAFGATGHLELFTGIAVVAVIAAFPQGATGFVLQLCGASARRITGAATLREEQTMLRVEDLSVSYGNVHALDGVSFEVAQRGVLHGIIGPNGAGKSTLMDAITGRRKPTRGRVWVDGEDITQRPVPWRRRRGMSRSFQRTSIFPG